MSRAASHCSIQILWSCMTSSFSKWIFHLPSRFRSNIPAEQLCHDVKTHVRDYGAWPFSDGKHIVGSGLDESIGDRENLKGTTKVEHFHVGEKQNGKRASLVHGFNCLRITANHALGPPSLKVKPSRSW